MRKSLIAVPVLLVAAAGGGYLVAQHIAETRLQETIAGLRASLGPNGTLTYASAKPNALVLGADLTGVAVKQGDTSATIAKLHITGAQADGARHIDADDIHIGEKNGWMSASHATLDGLVSPANDPQATRFEHLVLHSVHAHDNISGTDITADGTSVHDYGVGLKGGIAIDSIVLAPADAKLFDQIRFHHWQADGLDMAAWVARVQGGQKPTVMAAGTGMIQADDVALLKDGKTLVSVAQMAGTNAQPHGADNKDVAGAIETKMDVRGITITQAAAPEIAQLGYDALHIDVSLTQHYDSNAHTLSVAPLMISDPNAGSLKLSTELADVPAGTGGAMLAQLPGMRIASFGLTYTDASLAKRAIDAAAKAQNLTPDQIRQQMTIMSQVRQQQSPPPIAAVLDAVQKFVNKPGTLTVTMAPQPAITLASMLTALSDPATADSLHLTATAQ